jgi:transcriptional regulator with XRE-family HTH domain
MSDKVKKELLLKLAKRVKQLRLEKGLTQAQACIDSKIHFGRIEQGKRDISFTTLFKVCEYFEISANDFFENFND